MSKKDIVIGIAAHKPYQMPEDAMYMPLHVGREGKSDIGYVGDNTGDHISEKNPSFCELTGVYFLWKNVEAEYLGLVHYRRHFSLKRKGKDPFQNVLRYEEIKPLLGTYKIFVPQKRRYYIETMYSHYAHTHYASHLDETRKIIEEIYPDYLKAYDDAVQATGGYMFNMMIMQKELFADYCEWLFTILFELERRIGKDNDDLSAFQGRFYGRVSEIIFNAWLSKKVADGTVKPSEIKELPYIYMEKINWNRKIASFLKAKFGHKKYEGSF